MYPGFELFNYSHFAIIAIIAVTAILLSYTIRVRPHLKTTIHLFLSVILISIKCSSLIYNFHNGIFPPHGLPLQLSDMTVFIVIITLLLEKQWSFELSYYWGLSGAVLAVLTPDLKYTIPYIPAVFYFLSHGIVIISIIVFVWGEHRRPERGSFLKAFLYMNCYAFLMSIFDFIFKTDYFFILHKPQGSTLLNYFGPWPFYIITADIFAFVLFWILSRPFVKINR